MSDPYPYAYSPPNVHIAHKHTVELKGVYILGNDARRGGAFAISVYVRDGDVEQLARDLLTHLYGPLSALAIEQEYKRDATR